MPVLLWARRDLMLAGRRPRNGLARSEGCSMHTVRMPQVAGRRRWTALGLVPLLALAGCQGMSGTEKGALVGAGTGAVAGNLIAKGVHGSRTAGAAIGAVGGLIGGALIGNQVDKAEQRGRAEGAAAATAAAQPVPTAPTLAQVVDMTQRGVTDRVIINQIRTSGARYNLSPEEVAYLSQSGVSSAVIQEMQFTAS